MNIYKLLRLCAALCVATTISGCAAVQMKSDFKPPVGMIFTHVKAPMTVQFDKTEVNNHYGESTAMFLMDPFLTGATIAWKDCSLESAAKNGELKSVDYADYELYSILGIFCKTTVRAYGEKAAE